MHIKTTFQSVEETKTKQSDGKANQGNLGSKSVYYVKAGDKFYKAELGVFKKLARAFLSLFGKGDSYAESQIQKAAKKEFKQTEFSLLKEGDHSPAAGTVIKTASKNPVSADTETPADNQAESEKSEKASDKTRPSEPLTPEEEKILEENLKKWKSSKANDKTQYLESCIEESTSDKVLVKIFDEIGHKEIKNLCTHQKDIWEFCGIRAAFLKTEAGTNTKLGNLLLDKKPNLAKKVGVLPEDRKDPYIPENPSVEHPEIDFLKKTVQPYINSDKKAEESDKYFVRSLWSYLNETNLLPEEKDKIKERYEIETHWEGGDGKMYSDKPEEGDYKEVLDNNWRWDMNKVQSELMQEGRESGFIK